MTCILHKDFGLLKKSPRKCGGMMNRFIFMCTVFLFRVVLLLCRIYDVYCFVKKNRCSLLENIHFDTKEVLPFFFLWQSGPDGSRTHFRTSSLDFRHYNHHYLNLFLPRKDF